jgi:tripartite-type tricarboxylate transporter receptor subunit TctC
MFKKSLKFCAATLGLLVSVGVGAQDYPSKPLRMIVPFPPGGVMEIVARAVAVKLAIALGQAVVAENRAGASGVIGAEAGARSPDDGSTFVMGNISTLEINPVTFAKLPYDPIASFDPVSMVAIQPLIIAVQPSRPVQSLSELVQYAKSQPGKLNYDTAGSSIHLAVEFFSTAAGVKMNHIPYQGSASALTDLIGGQVQVLFDPFLSIYPFVSSGKVRALALTTDKRSATATTLPTVAVSGYANFDVSSLQGIVVRARTPKSAIQRLNQDLVKVLSTSEMKERFAQYSAVTAASTPEQFSSYIKEEMARWQQVAIDAGVKPQ